ncbi:alpha/beta hydrolase [Hymenobacter swuensis]|uniref:Alpha/beta hydrolase n=1 Tax=Hymenobacter swuensis DY53 TaxID=1227739 RepID=W8EUQ6_9BACT|nr:alpha/beta hydrolase [Hymenobacter swuensis]AHJ96278.1 alpha/beta hydrolase [Hymenobacter swuensis DY53]
MKALLFTIFLGFSSPVLHAQPQPVIPLYEGPVPNARPSNEREVVVTQANGSIRVSNVLQPTLTVFRPAKANGTAVIICPGGGYARLAIDHEGYDVARRLNEWGITAFVLKYRLPNSETQLDKTTAPLLDAQQALRLVRQRSQAFGLNPTRIGLMGFSAGGHLAAWVGASRRGIPGYPAGTLSTTSATPDFLVLLYPVISFSDSLAHLGSRTNLLGERPTAAQIRLYSADEQVTAQTPPVFLLHAQDDEVVKVQNSLRFYEACLQHKVPVEMHLYPKGSHGFGMHNPTTPDHWMDRLHNWLDAGGWLR